MYGFETQKDFEDWLSKVSIKAKKLTEKLSDSMNLDDYDVTAIKALSEWILDNFSNIRDIKNDPELWDELSCYIGEVYIKTLDAEWSIELGDENKDNVFFQIPIISCNPPPPICPLKTITALISRKDSSFIVNSIEKRLRNKSVS